MTTYCGVSKLCPLDGQKNSVPFSMRVSERYWLIRGLGQLSEISNEEILLKVIDVLRDQAVWLDEAELITPESKIYEDLDLDDTYELWISSELDEVFDISMPNDFLKPGVTVSDLCSLVEAQISESFELRTVSPDNAEESKRAVDWLIESFDPESTSALAQWPGRYESAALTKYAVLKRTYPEYLDKATKYLFDAASTGFDQIETALLKSEIETRAIDRRASMVGGFPWTDANNPWPKWDHPDGHTIWGEPVFQLNLATLSEQLGVPLPPILLQFWDHFDLVEVPLAATMTGGTHQPAEPDWFIPERSKEPPVGWTHSDESKVGSYIRPSDPNFQLPKMEAFLTGGIAYWDEYVFQSDEDWKDPSEWEEARPVPTEISEKLLADEEAVYDVFAAAKVTYTAFLGVPRESNITYEDWVKDGYRALYSASGSGLSIWSGGFIQVFYRVCDGKFEFATQVGS